MQEIRDVPTCALVALMRPKGDQGSRKTITMDEAKRLTEEYQEAQG